MTANKESSFVSTPENDPFYFEGDEDTSSVFF